MQVIGIATTHSSRELMGAAVVINGLSALRILLKEGAEDRLEVSIADSVVRDSGD
jgi:hypothetical protein